MLTAHSISAVSHALQGLTALRLWRASGETCRAAELAQGGRLTYELSVRAPTVALTVFIAHLFATSSDQLILPLNGARPLKVNGDGLLLHGTEVVEPQGKESASESYTQAWHCELG